MNETVLQKSESSKSLEEALERIQELEEALISYKNLTDYQNEALFRMNLINSVSNLSSQMEALNQNLMEAVKKLSSANQMIFDSNKLIASKMGFDVS